MPKDPNKPGSRARTEDLRREIEASSALWQHPLRSRAVAWGLVIWAVFVVVVGATAVWTRQQPRVAEGRVMSTTRTAGVRFSFTDKAATEQAQTMARARARRVYVAVEDLLPELKKSLEALPAIAREANSAEEVEPGIRQQFALNDAALAALREHIGEFETSSRWMDMVSNLTEALSRQPLLARDAAQIESQALNPQMELRQKDVPPLIVPSVSAINVESPDINQRLRQIVTEAGFEPPLVEVVATRLSQPLRPTYTFDADATAGIQDRAAREEPPKVVTYPEKEVIYRRGDVLTAAQLGVTREAITAEQRGQSFEKVWVWRGALLGLVGAIALAMLGYTILFVARVRRNPARMAAIAGLLGAMAVLACVTTAMWPGLVALTAVAPTVFCAMVLCIAYNQRIALGYGALHGLLVCAAINLPVGVFAVILAGVGIAVWRLKEIRERDTLIQAGVFVGLTLAAGTMLASVMDLPLTTAGMIQSATDAGWAGFGGVLTAMVVLFILPSMEKAFGITTGLTLIELRDPRQPLLRQLQQRAPGTYNHSLTLASLGEAAAEAIGADGLLTYVGALYHDIGKMNKPDYFVENQQPGFNRHDKLSPAMSLLIIVGHVKDGLELAREFNLPRALWHFIESHHGTTLVEYFFHRAKRRSEVLARSAAAGDEDEPPTEMEYRYPGPKPRSREAAIIMICDAVESAARALADPTPNRIDTLVRAIATKRLMDGQFDECDLTLKELNLIVEAVSKTLASIYHGRIAYPGGEPARGTPRTTVPVTGTVSTSANGGSTVRPREAVKS